MSIQCSARRAAILLLVSSTAYGYDRIQPPEIASGQRAGLAGELAKLSIGPGDVERGAFSLSSPFTAPGERGELQASIFPTYNPDNGISPWGLGFDTALSITRHRIAGSIDYSDADELASPFGRLVRGSDGDWYPVGIEPRVRVHASGDDLIAYQPDGSTWTFGGTARVVTPRGTYAWHLRDVTSATDRHTTLAWTANSSGQLFLSSVSYGGVHGNAQYRIDLAYEAVVALDADDVERPRFVDYRAGVPLAMDRRVTTVTVRARNAQTGAFDERWHYTLTYNEETVGAAFYLARIDRTFASGESAPPVMYGYNLRGARLATTQLTEVPQLTQLFQQLGVAGDIVQPQWSAVADADFDGNADLELGTADRTLVLTRGSGTADDPLHFDVSALPPPSAPACQSADDVNCTWSPCRPASFDDRMPPRQLVQMHPDDQQLDVIAFQYDSDVDQTDISICTRDGVRIAHSQVWSAWSPQDTVRFVDLDHDHLPDLVRVSTGHYDILPNITTRDASGTSYAWGAPIGGNLLDRWGQPVAVTDVWVSDASGDGIPDLESVVGDELYVWHGLGNFEFAETAETFRFTLASGMPLGLDGLKLIPADLNKDGLQDFFVTNADPWQARTIMYFTNVGAKFVETPIAALQDLSYTASPPVIGGFDASGNTTVTLTDLGHAYSVALDGPETGLMAWADDGKGTVVRFGYARGPAEPGIRHRCALLAHLEIQTSGYDTIAYDYHYAGATLHSIGKFPLGFASVVRTEPLGSTTLSFLNADAYAGVLLGSTEVDTRVPGIAKFSERTYDDATLAGIPWKRLRTERSGWRTPALDLADTTTYDAYDGICPSQTTAQTSHGTLVTQTTRAAVLAGHLHCLEARVTRTGTHDDPSLDFRIDQTIARNAAGQVTELDSGTLVEQVLTYDGDGNLASVAAPGKGTVTATYDPVTKLLASVTAPDGVITRADARDPRTDGLLTRTIVRAGMVLHEQARYDGQERLASRWNDVDGSSEATPAETYTYAYATTNTPASVAIHTLVDPGSYRDHVELYTGGDERLATAVRAPGGWVFDGFDAISRATRERDHFVIGNQAASPATLDYATLLAGSPARVQTQALSAFGVATATTTTFHAGVEKDTATSLSVDALGLLHTEVVNATYATARRFDASGALMTAYRDETGTMWFYRYDAAGRLRIVTLPDGSHHQVTYDDYGRTSSIRRDGVALAAYAYRGTDQVASITWSSPTGTPVRSEAFTYDAAGRVTSHAHTDLATGATKTFALTWDGDLETAVSGPGFAKTFRYRADGKLVHRSIAIDGYRTIEADLAYLVDGTPRDRTVTLESTTGAVLATARTRDGVDGYGRIATTSLDDAPLASYSYDAFARPSAIAFANGDAVTFLYDGLTRQRTGHTQTRADGAWGGTATIETLRDARGFAGTEQLSVGGNAVTRAYGYSPQGFLTSTEEQ